MKLRNKSILFLILIMVCCFSTNVFAYTTLGQKWSSRTIRYYYENYNSARAKLYIAKGANGWSGTDVSFTRGTAGNYNIYCTGVNNANVSWDGLTTSYYSGSYFTSQVLQLNSAKTNTWNSNGALQSVAIHEFGHCLGLDHSAGAVSLKQIGSG